MWQGPALNQRPTGFEPEALQCLGALYSFACTMVAAPADAEDLVQATYAKALRHRAQWVAGTNLRAWLFRILRNEFLDRCRRDRCRAVVEQLTPDGELPEAVNGEPGPEELAGRRFAAVELRAALVSLPEALRLAVYLRDVEGLDYRGIATALGCPMGTVMSRLNRGRAALRAKLLANGMGGA